MIEDYRRGQPPGRRSLQAMRARPSFRRPERRIARWECLQGNLQNTSEGKHQEKSALDCESKAVPDEQD
jgi:hypothetical protein